MTEIRKSTFINRINLHWMKPMPWHPLVLPFRSLFLHISMYVCTPFPFRISLCMYVHILLCFDFLILCTYFTTTYVRSIVYVSLCLYRPIFLLDFTFTFTFTCGYSFFNIFLYLYDFFLLRFYSSSPMFVLLLRYVPKYLFYLSVPSVSMPHLGPTHVCTPFCFYSV
jgi:hypothetical protein